MVTVERILQQKGSGVWRTSPDASVFDALALMAEKNVGALVVMQKDIVAGIVSERDYARKVALLGRQSKHLRVAEIMSTDLICISPQQTVQDCMTLMLDHRIRHLPVLRDGVLAGIVSIGDVVKAVIDDQHQTIDSLENYITGRR